jgi:hypothetical protein
MRRKFGRTFTSEKDTRKVEIKKNRERNSAHRSADDDHQEQEQQFESNRDRMKISDGIFPDFKIRTKKKLS